MNRRMPTARLITAEEAETQRHVNKVLREAREKQERENLERSLIQRGELAPVVTRDFVGRPVTNWIGSVKGFLAPFSQPPMKASMNEGDRKRRADARYAREQAAYAALAREERRSGG